VIWTAAAAAFAAAVVVTALLAARPPGRLRRHVKENYRRREVLATLGIVLLGALAVGAVAAAAVDVRGGLVTAGAGAVMGVLGLLDDVFGGAAGGGFAGHLRDLARGRVTTGVVKAAGGGLVGLGAAWILGHRGMGLVVAAAVVALVTNLVNLFDLRPGRVGKVWLLGWAAGLAAGPAPGVLVAGAAAAGGLAAFLPHDLRERAMLGDAGANLLGAVLGVTYVSAFEGAALVGVLGASLLLTVVSEVVSFSRVIEANAVLRALDRLGRVGDG
jgi:UDP-N-acetylmuramyl pentapeptide phosphotransferase/UDP-N-acetylglucosamine-1-phosphate transferase